VPIGSNPFIQVPTPIQRSFATGRQSFYISHAQQSSAYDEGDGIVPSTPTLFVPRRGDSFAEALNSPRVPQGRFVFSSSIPEASALSQLASEGTLGVDDTRMDLSQFDDNGRSVPTTPLAVSPAIDSGIQLGQSGDEVVEPYDTNVVIETPISSEFDNENRDSSRSNVETDDGENSKTSLKDNNNVSSFDLIDTNEGIEEEVSEQPDNETDIQNEEEEKEASDQNIFGQESDAVASTSTSGNTQRHAQTARRGRSFGPQRGPIQRRPIVWPTESSGESSPNKQSTGQNISQVQQQPQSSHQSGRRIRLRGASSKFSTRGDYRGGRPGRGSRGTYHYSKQ
jgi:nucleoprotein TPR